ncbi:MAG: ribonuclease P protein component [Bacteroidetes bacterium 4572_77]|nr:MAG: ribonuclease P protein component [Bacteroidetes bacterium 4572_77]
MNTLPKSESLKSKTLIRLLFQKGNADFVFPFKTLHTEIVSAPENNPRALLLISVGKRKIRNAVDRNHIKRLIREAYRKNKHELISLLENKEQHIALAFVYVGKVNPESVFIEEKLKIAISQLISALGK